VLLHPASTAAAVADIPSRRLSWTSYAAWIVTCPFICGIATEIPLGVSEIPKGLGFEKAIILMTDLASENHHIPGMPWCNLHTCLA